MGKVISKGYAKLGETGRSAGCFTSGASLRKRPPKKAPFDGDPLSASTPQEAMASAKDFLAKLKPNSDES